MPDSLAGKRLLIVEEALGDFVGHWYEYVKSVAELSRVEGAAITIAGHAAATPALREELDVLPAFEKTPWNGDYFHRLAPIRKLGLVRHNWLVFGRMRALLRREGPFDCTFVPTVVVHHIWAWRVLLRLYPRRIGRLVLLIRNNAASYAPGSSEPQFNSAARLFGRALRALATQIASGQVVIATDSDRLAEEYRQLCGVKPVVFPSPRVAAPAAARASKGKSGPLLFSCLGPARFEKGIDVLQQAIALVLAQGDVPIRFAVQWPSPISDEAGQPYPPDAALAESGLVDFLTEPLSSEAYDALLASTDCMVLPYRRSSYFARISGVAVEAVTGGIPVIATADTWTSELVETSGAGIAVPDGDAQALAEAMTAMALEYPRYRTLAEARRNQALAAHSGEGFINLLWGRETP
ncbi:MAG: glycosyltransferase family 4 protein [Croceibacterium sp.]